jgi:hypothetical protein
VAQRDGRGRVGEWVWLEGDQDRTGPELAHVAAAHATLQHPQHGSALGRRAGVGNLPDPYVGASVPPRREHLAGP